MAKIMRIWDESQQKYVGVPAIRGEKGDPFKYEDFTQEQLNNLKGESGDNGVYYGSTEPEPLDNGEYPLWVDPTGEADSPALLCYPVGSIYLSVVDIDPGTIFGGTWERIKDKFLLSAGDSYAAGSEGGEAEVTLTTAQTPEHSHDRGTMDITGGITAYSHYNKGNEDYWVNGVKGAFYKDTDWYAEEASTLNQSSSASDDTARKVSFQASRSWTGETSVVGGNEAHNNLPPYLAVYMWKRTA